MHKPESVLENKTHKILCDLMIQTDQLILVRRQDQVLINKRKEVGFYCSNRSQSENEIKQKDRQMLGFARELSET